MIALLDTSHDLKQCAAELAAPVEQLLTPLTRFRVQDPTAHFAIDNGAYSAFAKAPYLTLLAREVERQALCRFVVVPDVVGSARRTLEVFEHWWARQELQGWPLAYVAQDGQEDLPIPWARCAALFVGGSTAWKLGPYATHCIKAAQALGKWVHVGRCNTPGRWDYFAALGVDSIDGTGLARYSAMRGAIAAPRLFALEPGML